MDHLYDYIPSSNIISCVGAQSRKVYKRQRSIVR
jgi:hypothetical protein